jgi:MFS family permease
LPSAAFQSLRHRGVPLFLASRLFLITASQMVSVAIGWQVYELTKSPLHLGAIGLAIFVPAMAFSLLGGHASDRHDRRRILLVCIGCSLLCAGLLAAQAFGHAPSLAVIYTVAAIIGVIRAFSGPAGASFLPTLVPPADFGNAVAWSMLGFQVGSVVGPGVGGVVYAAVGSAGPVYLVAAGLYAAALLAMAFVPSPAKREAAAATLRSLLAGIAYVWKERIILGAMALDLFAVLLGGATALLPIFARDILGAGPAELGLLRSAPAIGAGLTALAIAFHPLRRRLGWTLLGGVALFGLATIVFGLSRSIPLSVASLAVAGAADMLSVNIRHTLIQMTTPDAMRGRVSAVAFVFIGASNELGEFESGVTAAWWGTARAVVVGGVGTCVVVAATAALFPRLRKVDGPPRPA